jgi:membrane-associated phospholipid phosphatase
LRKETNKSQIIKNNKTDNLGLKVFLAVVLVSVVSIRYLDNEIAIRVMHVIKTIHPLKDFTENIPDILLHFVVVATVLMWALYFYRRHRKKFDTETQFLQLAATVLPAAYIVKTLLKFVFGRTSARDWLNQNQEPSFHWFKIWSSSFPSGHMLVFAAFGSAILFYYPQYRRRVIIFLILLGIGLVGTDYHFLSDVIAGAYLGIMTTYFVRYMLGKQKNKS